MLCAKLPIKSRTLQGVSFPSTHIPGVRPPLFLWGYYQLNDTVVRYTDCCDSWIEIARQDEEADENDKCATSTKGCCLWRLALRYLLRIQYKYPSIATRGTCASIANGIFAVVVAVSDVAAVGVQRIMRLIGSKCGNFYNKQRGTWCVCYIIFYYIILWHGKSLWAAANSLFHADNILHVLCLESRLNLPSFSGGVVAPAHLLFRVIYWQRPITL